MDKWMIKKPKPDRYQNLPSTGNANYDNDLMISIQIHLLTYDIGFNVDKTCRNEESIRSF